MKSSFFIFPQVETESKPTERNTNKKQLERKKEKPMQY